MTIPKRHRRSITCASLEYHWYFPRGRDWDHRAQPELIVQIAQGDGQLLKVSQPSWPDVTPTFVAGAIAEALEQGWRPHEPLPPFTLRRWDASEG